MASVGQCNTTPEMKLRRVLHKVGLRYRLHDKRFPGTPDLVFPRFRVAAFVNGCFWHAHDDCRFATKPLTRKQFWKEKFSANRKRDKNNYSALAECKMRVLIVWECSLRGLKEDSLSELGVRIKDWISRSDESYMEIGRKL
jgi:DNA mismatch endonuclease (patch repair protein)